MNGWISIGNDLEKYPDRQVVINAAAQDDKGIEDHGEIFRTIIGMMKRELLMLFVINPERDSVELLLNYSEAKRRTYCQSNQVSVQVPGSVVQSRDRDRKEQEKLSDLVPGVKNKHGKFGEQALFQQEYGDRQ